MSVPSPAEGRTHQPPDAYTDLSVPADTMMPMPTDTATPDRHAAVADALRAEQSARIATALTDALRRGCGALVVWDGLAIHHAAPDARVPVGRVESLNGGAAALAAWRAGAIITTDQPTD